MSQSFGLRRYLVGAAVARTGDEMSGPALLLLGVAVTGSVSAGAALLAGLTAAAAVGGPLVGVALDRSPRPGRLLAAALAVYAAGLAGVAVGVGRAPLVVVVGAALLIGLLGPALSGGWTSQLPRVAGRRRLARGNAWDAMTFGAAALLGPALAGTVAAVAGAGAAVATAVVLLALALPVAWTLPGRASPREHDPVPSDLLAGFRAVCAGPDLRRATVVTSVSLAGTGMLVVSTPVLGSSLLGGEERGALLLSAMAVCSLAANLLLARRPVPTRADTVVLLCVLVQGAGAALAAAASSPAALVAALALVGAAEGPQLTSLFAVRHREAPERLRSQVFTTGASVKISAFALGAAVGGPLADVSATVCLATAAGAQVLAALLYPLSGPRRRRGPGSPRRRRIPRGAGP